MELRISSPCPKTWEELAGGDRVRYCGQCRLNVYNFAIMSRSEIEDVVRKTEGRLCGQLYLRGDRTVTARNCPATRGRTILKRAVRVAAVLLLAGFTWVCRTSERPSRAGLPEWLKVPLQMIDPEDPPPPRPVRLLGEIACPPPPPPAKAPAPTAGP